VVQFGAAWWLRGGEGEGERGKCADTRERGKDSGSMCYQSITEGRGLELSFESGRGAWRRESKAAGPMIQSGNDGGTTRVRKVRFFFFSSLFLLLSAMRSMCYLWQRRNRDSKDILSMAHAHVCKTRVPHPRHDPVCPRERLGARDDQHGTTGTCTCLLRHQYCLRHLAHAISTTGRRRRRGQSAGVGHCDARTSPALAPKLSI
jgi:hypothetical protein